MTPEVTAVVCTYTEERWEQFVAAVSSLRTQSLPPREVLVVVDHAPELARRAQHELLGVRVIENTEAQGLSGGRNTALREAQEPLVAFLDDDATAEPGWLASLGAHFEDPRVLGAGGRVTPRWQEPRPDWFPQEFDWVLGCTYRGLPESVAEVRNPFGGAMVIRRDEALAAGGFRTDLGRTGKHPAACEETELCIRLRSADPSATFLYDPDAEVHHFAPRERCTWRYFRRRCYAEGVTKAFIRSLAKPRGGALRTERGYVLKTLPKGFWRGLLAAARGRWSGLTRAGAIAGGLAWTTAGFVVGTVAGPRSRTEHPRAKESRPTDSRRRAASDAPFRPTWVTAMDVDAPLDSLVAPPSPSGTPYSRALIVALLHSQPIGVVLVELSNGLLTESVLRDRVVAGLEHEIAAHLAKDEGGTGACWFVGGGARPLPSFSVVLCTRNRPDQAELAIKQALDLDYPSFEIIVVDNAPADDATQRVVATFANQDPRVRYVREEKPGLANARNCGVAEARGDLVAFTDDDIRVSAGWLRALAQGFERTPDVVCVTGAVMAAAINTRAEELFDQAVPAAVKWGFEPRLFRPDERSPTRPLFPYQVGMYGGGGNAAFARDYLIGAGGFDPALGAGTATHGGEDLDAFLRVMVDGRHLAYEPAAYVWHLHHTDDRELRTQAFRYGVALGAFLFKIAFSRVHAARLLTRSPHGVRYLFDRSSEKNAQKSADFPLSLMLLELVGIVWGPAAYLQSRRRCRLAGTRAPA